METMKVNIEAISKKTKSVLVRYDNKQNWEELSDKLKPHINKLKKGEAEISFDKEGKVKYISTKKPEKPKKDNSEGMAEMSQLKARTNMRMSALTNATNLCIARGETNKSQVFNLAKEFLDFLEGRK